MDDVYWSILYSFFEFKTDSNKKIKMSLYYSMTPSKNLNLLSKNIFVSTTKVEDDFKEIFQFFKEEEEEEENNLFEDENSFKIYLEDEIKEKEKFYFSCFDKIKKKKIGFISFYSIDNLNKNLKIEKILGFKKEEESNYFEEFNFLIFESFLILFDYLFEHCKFERIEFIENFEKFKNLFDNLILKNEGIFRNFNSKEKIYKNVKSFSLLSIDWEFGKDHFKKLKCKL